VEAKPEFIGISPWMRDAYGARYPNVSALEPLRTLLHLSAVAAAQLGSPTGRMTLVNRRLRLGRPRQLS
jgi:hypothetical protein